MFSTRTERPASMAGLALLCLAGCECGDRIPELRREESLPAGKASIPNQRGSGPLATLPQDARARFHAGRALARQPWVRAPTTTDARDGLGPLYNARSCFACHPNAGRGKVPRSTGEPVLGGALVRLSVPGQNPTDGVVPEPRYGAQLQTKSVALSSLLGRDTGRKGEVKPEAKLTLHWSEQTFNYPDGSKAVLRRPEPVLANLAYGALAENTMMSFRNAPPLYGLGLIEAIPQAAVAALADEDDANGDGVSGRLNWVWDRTSQQRVPGRFGLKANQPSLHQQVAGAFAGDVGITSPVFPGQPCTSVQPECIASPSGAGADGVEISADLLAMVVDFVRHTGVPTRTEANAPEVVRGRAVFYRTGCASCHHPNFVTVATDPALDGHTIWPYADFLLHDMGEGLADGRPDYDASGREWRTPPLWAGSHDRRPGQPLHLMHDGRADTYEEAVLWHEGEARAARDAFASSSADDRAALVRFLESL